MAEEDFFVGNSRFVGSLHTGPWHKKWSVTKLQLMMLEYDKMETGHHVFFNLSSVLSIPSLDSCSLQVQRREQVALPSSTFRGLIGVVEEADFQYVMKTDKEYADIHQLDFTVRVGETLGHTHGLVNKAKIGLHPDFQSFFQGIDETRIYDTHEIRKPRGVRRVWEAGDVLTIQVGPAASSMTLTVCPFQGSKKERTVKLDLSSMTTPVLVCSLMGVYEQWDVFYMRSEVSMSC